MTPGWVGMDVVPVLVWLAMCAHRACSSCACAALVAFPFACSRQKPLLAPRRERRRGGALRAFLERDGLSSICFWKVMARAQLLAVLLLTVVLAVLGERTQQQRHHQQRQQQGGQSVSLSLWVRAVRLAPGALGEAERDDQPDAGQDALAVSIDGQHGVVSITIVPAGWLRGEAGAPREVRVESSKTIMLTSAQEAQESSVAIDNLCASRRTAPRTTAQQPAAGQGGCRAAHPRKLADGCTCSSPSQRTTTEQRQAPHQPLRLRASTGVCTPRSEPCRAACSGSLGALTRSPAAAPARRQHS